MGDNDKMSGVGAGFIPARNAQEKFPVRKKIRLLQTEYRRGHLFFITIGTHKRHPWFKLHPDLADTFIDVLKDLAGERDVTLFAWCIMPDHVHLLLQDKDVVEFVRRLKGRVTPNARKKESGRKLWQRSFYDHALRKEESVYLVTMYIWENPVREGMVEEPHLYKWSGSEVWPNLREYYGHWR